MKQPSQSRKPSDVIQAAFKLTGMEQRRAEMRDILAQISDLHAAELASGLDWFTLTTAGYLVGPPLGYYWEPAFVEYGKALRSVFASARDFALEASRVTGLIDAVFRVEHLAFEIDKEDLSGHQTTAAVRRYLARWYLELCDQILDVLLRLPACGLARRSGNTAPSDLINLVEFLRKAGWVTCGEAYSPTVRNGIAHELTFETELAGRVQYAVFTDKRGNRERRTLDELRHDVELLLDQALAYALALRLYVLKSACEPGVARLLVPTQLSPEVREQAFRDFASTDRFEIRSASIDIVSNQRQLTVEALDSTDHEVERMVHIISNLYEAANWFPDADRIVIGAKGKGRLPSLVAVDGCTLRSWASGDISNQDLFAKADVLLWPFRRLFGRWRHKLRYVAGHARAEWDRHWEASRISPRYRFLSADDISIGLARRYRAEAVLKDTPSEESIRATLQDAVRKLRSMTIHRNKQVRKRWGRTPPHYVSVFLYAREKRRRDRWADLTSAFYLGRAEFRDPNFQGVLPESELPDVAADGLTLEVSPNWRRAKAPMATLDDPPDGTQ
jgi:hypothetical protein